MRPYIPFDFDAETCPNNFCITLSIFLLGTSGLAYAWVKGISLERVFCC